jgi:hypothetical protein
MTREEHWRYILEATGWGRHTFSRVRWRRANPRDLLPWC